MSGMACPQSPSPHLPQQTPEPYSYGTMRTKQKQRFVAQVVRPRCVAAPAERMSPCPANRDVTNHVHAALLAWSYLQVTPANPHLLHGLVDEDVGACSCWQLKESGGRLCCSGGA